MFSPPTATDSLSIGMVMSMLVFDAVIYLIIALYMEALIPGTYGIAKPWYFPFTKSYWFGKYGDDGES